MKLALILVAILGLANASLKEDIDEIKALIPIPEIRAITAEYIANDPEVQLVVSYLQSDDFLAIANAVKATPEYGELVQYLADAGLNIEGFLAWVRNAIGLDLSVKATTGTFTLGRSFHGWVNEIRALIPWSDLIALIRSKLQTSPDFQDFVAQLSSAEFQAIVEAVVAVDEYQALLDLGRDHGAPVDAWIDRLYTIFGWSKA